MICKKSKMQRVGVCECDECQSGGWLSVMHEERDLFDVRRVASTDFIAALTAQLRLHIAHIVCQEFANP